jgi:hypothetical protein
MALKHGTEAITEAELENALTTYLRALNQAAGNGIITHRTVTSQWHGADLFVQWLKGVYNVPTHLAPVVKPEFEPKPEPVTPDQ